MDGDCLIGIIGVVLAGIAIFFVAIFVIGLAASVLAGGIAIGGIYGCGAGVGRSVHTYFSEFNKRCH